MIPKPETLARAEGQAMAGDECSPNTSYHFDEERLPATVQCGIDQRTFPSFCSSTKDAAEVSVGSLACASIL